MPWFIFFRGLIQNFQRESPPFHLRSLVKEHALENVNGTFTAIMNDFEEVHLGTGLGDFTNGGFSGTQYGSWREKISRLK